MAEKNQKKNKKISDEEILTTLREAVLKSIGSSATAKKALSKIESASEDLSKDLKTIGRKLVRKQQTKKSDDALKLTPKDIEKIKMFTEDGKKKTSSASTAKKPSPKKSTGSMKTKKKTVGTPAPTPPTTEPFAKRDDFVISKTPTESVMDAPPKRLLPALARPKFKMLPKPSFLDRVTLSFSIGKALAILGILLLLLAGAFTYLFYKTSVTNVVIDSVATTLHLPIAKINGQKINYAEFNADVQALNSFFEDDTNATNFNVSPNGEKPSLADIRTLVLERQTRVLLIRQALAQYGQSVTDAELEGQLDEIIRASGGTEALEQIVSDLYNWTTQDFIQKALLPLLEEEKLTIHISQDPELNAEKAELINTIAGQVRDGLGFAEAAAQYSEDVTADQGGDLDWFTKGTMVPEFEDEITNLEVGQISQPFLTSFGWHIAQLTEKDTSDPENIRYRASHILIDYIDIDEYLTKLRDQSDIKIYIQL